MSGKALGPTMNDWNKARDFSENFPETCPICHQKWRHCVDYDDHITKVGDDEDDLPESPEHEKGTCLVCDERRAVYQALFKTWEVEDGRSSS